MRIEKDPLLHAINTIQMLVERALTAKADHRSAHVLLTHGTQYETGILFGVESMDERQTHQCKLTFTHEDLSSGHSVPLKCRVPVMWFDDFESRPTMERLNTTQLLADTETMQPQLEAFAQRVLDVIAKT